jgi:hypothetical protein
LRTGVVRCPWNDCQLCTQFISINDNGYNCSSTVRAPTIPSQISSHNPDVSSGCPEALRYGCDHEFLQIQHIKETIRSLQNQDKEFQGQQLSAEIANTFKKNPETERESPIFPYIVPTDVLLNTAGYDPLLPTGIEDLESSQPEPTPTKNSTSSNDSNIAPEGSSLKPRRYFLIPMSLMQNRRRMNNKPPQGNNRFGRKGVGRCTHCRKARQKVFNSISL